MNEHLQEVLNTIAEEYGSAICHDGRNYVEIDIGNRLVTMDYQELKERYNGIDAIVPLKEPANGMKSELTNIPGNERNATANLHRIIQYWILSDK
jgi:hypothetical protein